MYRLPAMLDSLVDSRYPLSGGVSHFMAVRGIPLAPGWSMNDLEHLSGMLEQVLSWGGDLTTIRRVFAETSTLYEARRRYAGWLVCAHHARTALQP